MDKHTHKDKYGEGGGDKYTEGHTHGGTHIWRDTHTEKHTYEGNINTEGHIEKGTYIRRGTYMDKHIYKGKYGGGEGRTNTWRDIHTEGNTYRGTHT